MFWSLYAKNMSYDYKKTFMYIASIINWITKMIWFKYYSYTTLPCNIKTNNVFWDLVHGYSVENVICICPTFGKENVFLSLNVSSFTSGTSGDLRPSEKLISALKLSGFVDISVVSTVNAFNFNNKVPHSWVLWLPFGLFTFLFFQNEWI